MKMRQKVDGDLPNAAESVVERDNKGNVREHFVLFV